MKSLGITTEFNQNLVKSLHAHDKDTFCCMSYIGLIFLVFYFVPNYLDFEK